jgi:hypothetical protein
VDTVAVLLPLQHRLFLSQLPPPAARTAVGTAETEATGREVGAEVMDREARAGTPESPNLRVSPLVMEDTEVTPALGTMVAERATATDPTKAAGKATATDPTKAVERATATDLTKAVERATATDLTKAVERATATDPTKAVERATATGPTKAVERATATDLTKVPETEAVSYSKNAHKSHKFEN